ncbi:MAG TPA: ABC-F family ATP-binding cassette domain-containing protein [Cyclobacteriaceae bacterium]|nr:ABC-F family ATP-binding cassette domain-containing protein [Cyclobacteriaceae bacterium]HMV09495.1 ABC-F family ATP-binding cassette domain-containing protein [Cyclobacteriaceae bacterium]HMV90099.1 ABC-F family ATP-binding cassette domain-containing protein [Cyclobacteriaceae bacterium]HMX02672.1 ABC-F family ATP-binding cassette domain-containing protein [Cyclobacteriaceae bacterium]HMX51605.1 ABC-F family ATP-binding cassette domain-containing protein [Cyclobacteriaceae bacterium]
MNYLSAESISKSFHDKWLFKDISLGISQGEKFALVGNNGVGKSTLLKILTGELPSDSGKVSVREGITTGFLTQDPRVDDSVTVKDVLFSDSNEIAKVVKEYEDCLQHPDVSPERMQAVLEKMEELNAWDYEAKVHEIIGKLGVPDLDKTFGQLSGGQRKRIFLAQMLLTEPDLIIMDEPTNHLDLTAIEWLENYLAGQQVTLIMVTHDRYFLDNVATEIIEIDRGQLFRYKGNYAYFLEKKNEREEMLKVEVSKARQLLKKELEWMRKQPRARGTKAKYRVEAFYDIQEKASQDIKKDKLELDFKASRQGGKILEVEHVSKSYGSLKIVDDFSYVFKKNDRIGVVGKNGVGKSTFLDILTGKLKPDTGEVIPGVTTKYGYFTQETITLNPANRVVEEVKAIAEFIVLADGSQISASKFLETFLFTPDKQYNYIDKLSGGEKKRLQLLKLLITNPNFLILDEPTNDFDIDTLNVLEDFLEKFGGCLLLVSHDRYFMDHLVDQLFVFEGDGKIRLFNGNYSDYRNWADGKEQESTPVATVVETSSKNSSKTSISYKDKQEFGRLQEEIAALERQRDELTQRMNNSTSDSALLIEIAKDIERLSSQIDAKTNRWFELSALMDSE